MAAKRPLNATSVPMSKFFPPLPSVRIPRNLRLNHFLASRSQPSILSPRMINLASSEDNKSTTAPLASCSTKHHRQESVPKKGHIGAVSGVKKDSKDRTRQHNFSAVILHGGQQCVQSEETQGADISHHTQRSFVKKNHSIPDRHKRGENSDQFSKDSLAEGAKTNKSSGFARSEASPTAGASKAINRLRYHTRCRYWERGHCRKGNQCPFKHILRESLSDGSKEEEQQHKESDIIGHHPSRRKNPFGGSLF